MTVKTLLLTPLFRESAGIRKALALASAGDGLWSNDALRVGLVHIGMGPERAARATAETLDSVKPRCVVLLGLAGGARAGLASGDIVLVKRGHTTGEDFSLDDGLLARGRNAVKNLNRPDIVGTSLEVHHVIHSSDEKARKGQVPGADIVDMETVSVARAAAQRDIPCAAVRVIFDDVSENLLPLDRFCDLDGRTLIGPTLLYLVSHPWHIPRLLDYGTRAKAAARLLGEFAAEFLSDESR